MTEPLLSVRDLHIHFGGIRAADGIDLDVHEGETLAIIGPNGAGKTTFINLCTGYLKPTSGSVHFQGKPIVGMAPRRITRSGIARSFQIPQLFLEHTALENLMLAAAARDDMRWPWLRLRDLPQQDEMRELLDLFGLGSVADKPIRELAEGVRKLIDIAVALALKPRLLLMDEPTSGVSSAEKVGIMDTLARALAARRVTSVFVEHDMEIVERYARRIAVWSAGRILALGPPSQVMRDPEVLRNVTGV